MQLHTSSYFAGVATVIATIALGFGGGILMTDAFVGKSDNPRTLAERRASAITESSGPVVAVAPNAETAPNPAPPMAHRVVAAAPSPAPPVANPAGAVPQPQPAVSAPSLAAPAEQPIAAPQAAVVPASAPALAVVHTQPPKNDEAMAKARDEDVKKALATERRKAERRKWAERRKQEMKKIEELNAVAEKVKDAERERAPIVRSFVAQSPGILIGDD